MPTTVSPRASRARATCDPMNPAAPVTRTDMERAEYWKYVAENQGAARLQRFVPGRNLETGRPAGTARQWESVFLRRPHVRDCTRQHSVATVPIYECQGGCHAARGDPGRQIPAGKRTRLPDRHAGPGAPADDAAPARPRPPPQHGPLQLPR